MLPLPAPQSGCIWRSVGQGPPGTLVGTAAVSGWESGTASGPAKCWGYIRNVYIKILTEFIEILSRKFNARTGDMRYVCIYHLEMLLLDVPHGSYIQHSNCTFTTLLPSSHLSGTYDRCVLVFMKFSSVTLHVTYTKYSCYSLHQMLALGAIIFRYRFTCVSVCCLFGVNNLVIQHLLENANGGDHLGDLNIDRRMV